MAEGSSGDGQRWRRTGAHASLFTPTSPFPASSRYFEGNLQPKLREPWDPGGHSHLTVPSISPQGPTNGGQNAARYSFVPRQLRRRVWKHSLSRPVSESLVAVLILSFLILLREKLRNRRVKNMVPDHRAAMWQEHDCKPASAIPPKKYQLCKS